MRTTNLSILFLSLAIGASALSVLLSLFAISAKYLRASSERDPHRRTLEEARLAVSDDPSMHLPTLSMADRQRNIETMLRSLEDRTD